MPTGVLLAVVICAMPLLSALILAPFGKRATKWGDLVGIGAMGVSLACAIGLAVWYATKPEAFFDPESHAALQTWSFEWLKVGGKPWVVGIALDGATLAVLIVVTVVSFLVHLFSKGYMHGDSRYADFYRWLGFFTFSMLVLVVSDNLLTLFIAWELMGLSSYKLIGHYFQKESAYLACKKAFMVTRIGDVGMFLGLMALYMYTGTLQFTGVFAGMKAGFESGAIPMAAITWISLGLFMGAAGKSAQFPLHIWLPDAMEGPTPVSALIHAATMVAAGVYLVGRMMSLISMSATALLVISIVGCFTAIFAASIAFTGTDIKKVLAYSTISQLGFMFTALGVGSNVAWQAGMFHLVTHAFFKGCLFLCSGSVILACHHEQDMTRMGGLWKKLPITGWTYLISCLAISGFAIPFTPIGTAGFFSKDQILLGLWQGNGGPYDPVYKVLFVVIAFTATMTACYMFRSFWLTFFTKPRDAHVHEHAHESPFTMTVPLMALAALALFAGYAWPSSFLPDGAAGAGGEHGEAAASHVLPYVTFFKGAVYGHEDVHHAHTMAVVFSAIACFGGIGLSAWWYLTASGERSRKALRAAVPAIYEAARRKFFMDDIAETLVVRPCVFLGDLLGWSDGGVVDGIVDGVGSVARATGDASGRADDVVVDGAVHATAGIAWGGGGIFSRLQTGRLRNYFFGAVGTIALFALIVLYMTWS